MEGNDIGYVPQGDFWIHSLNRRRLRRVLIRPLILIARTLVGPRVWQVLPVLMATRSKGASPSEEFT